MYMLLLLVVYALSPVQALLTGGVGVKNTPREPPPGSGLLCLPALLVSVLKFWAAKIKPGE